MNLINGKKSYLLAGAAIVYALYAHFILNAIDVNQMMDVILGAGGLSTLRHAISKI